MKVQRITALLASALVAQAEAGNLRGTAELRCKRVLQTPSTALIRTELYPVDPSALRWRYKVFMERPAHTDPNHWSVHIGWDGPSIN